MWANPALAPFNVIPRIKKIVSTKYGNMDVKYTTFKSSRNKRMRWYTILILFNFGNFLARTREQREDPSPLRGKKNKTDEKDLFFILLTFPDDCIPFITIKKTTIQLNSRQRTIHHFRPLDPSSIEGAASRVVLYQK